MELRSLLMNLLKQPSVEVLDESDALLSVQSQLVYTHGVAAHLPSMQTRVLLVQELLGLLTTDDYIAGVLANSNVAERTFSDNHLGGGPGIRLLTSKRSFLATVLTAFTCCDVATISLTSQGSNSSKTGYVLKTCAYFQDVAKFI
jgi:hypothetical protein